MSMIGEYARLTPAELDRAVQDPRGARELIDALVDAVPEQGAGGCPPRCLDIDKAWDTLRFLLRRVGFPVDIVHGEEEIPGADDWGYGPPRYLAPQQVREAAAAMAGMSGEDLIRGVTAAEIAQADLYPGIAEEDELWPTCVADHYEALVPFFRAAADSGDAILVWLD